MVISMFRLHVMCKRNVEISIKFFEVFSKRKNFYVLLQVVFERNMETSKFLRVLP